VCDSFEGMPETVAEDNFHAKGDFSDTGAEKVIKGLSRLNGNFQAHVGFFSDTIPKLAAEGPRKLSFAHIDADLYESVRDALEFCYPRMSPGGLIILDDYGAPTCAGAKHAADEFFSTRPETIVKLSHPAHGCVVGGGDAFDILIARSRFAPVMAAFSGSIFQRGDT
jgi:O-methyltransferase